MIFIQPLEKMHAKANDKVKIRSRSSAHVNKPDIDSVHLSDAANHAVEVDIKGESYTRLNAQMSLEASLLQAAFQSLNTAPLTVLSLDELKLYQSTWQLALQQPPNTKPQFKNHYGLGIKKSPTDILNYRFHIPVLSAAKQLFEFHLELRTARFTQATNQWPQPDINPIQLDAIASPYSGHFLQDLNKHTAYFFDQDGDEKQTAPILSAMQNKEAIQTQHENTFYNGLRVWRCQENGLRIVLLGAPELGAIYLANLKA